MGVAVIAVVFVAGLIGVPSIFGHGDAHAKPQQQQVASVQAPAQVAEADTRTAADVATNHP